MNLEPCDLDIRDRIYHKLWFTIDEPIRSMVFGILVSESEDQVDLMTEQEDQVDLMTEQISLKLQEDLDGQNRRIL